MATKFVNKKNKKIIFGIIAIAVIIILAVAGLKIYKNMNSKIYSGEGLYYYQQDNGKRLHFNEDKTFSYTVQDDDGTETVSNGTWSQNGNESTLTYKSGAAVTLVESEDGYLYRKDRIFRGKTSDKKLLNNGFVFEENDKAVEYLWFMEDGTVDIETVGDSKMKHGTYTRVDNILIVRYTTAPDSFNNTRQVVERYLVLENGITKEIYNKQPVENVAK